MFDIVNKSVEKVIVDEDAIADVIGKAGVNPRSLTFDYDVYFPVHDACGMIMVYFDTKLDDETENAVLEQLTYEFAEDDAVYDLDASLTTADKTVVFIYLGYPIYNQNEEAWR